MSMPICLRCGCVEGSVEDKDLKDWKFLIQDGISNYVTPSFGTHKYIKFIIYNGCWLGLCPDCQIKDPCKDEKWLYPRTDTGKEIITLKNRVDKLERDFNDHGHYVETTTICHNG